MKNRSSGDWVGVADRFGSPIVMRIPVAVALTSWALGVSLPEGWATSLFTALFSIAALIAIVAFYVRWRPRGHEFWWPFSRLATWSRFMLWTMMLPSTKTRFPSNARQARVERIVFAWSVVAWMGAVTVALVGGGL